MMSASMRRRFSRISTVLWGAASVVALIACRKVLGIDPGHARPETDAGSSVEGEPDASSDPTTSLPPLGQVDASCGNTTNDAKNCGECGRDCRGGTCSSGRCTPYPLALNLTHPGPIAVTEEGLYWADITKDTNKGAVRRCDIDGCQGSVPRLLFERDDSTFFEVAVQDDLVYALSLPDEQPWTCGTLGCAQNPGSLFPKARVVRTTKEAAYYVSSFKNPTAEQGVWRCAHSSCTSRTQLTKRSDDNIAVLGSDVYVMTGSDSATNESLIRCTAGDCKSPTTLLTGITYPGGAIGATPWGILFTAQTPAASEDTALALYTCEAKTCAGGPRILAKTGGYLDGFAADDRYVYWTNPEYGTVERVAWTSSNAVPEVLLKGQDLAWGIVMMGGALYYSRPAFGDIVRYVPPP
jgi:hypothetical protein